MALRRAPVPYPPEGIPSQEDRVRFETRSTTRHAGQTALASDLFTTAAPAAPTTRTHGLLPHGARAAQPHSATATAPEAVRLPFSR
jgi:hypothetical protein